jgi:hypothetical protein
MVEIVTHAQYRLLCSLSSGVTGCGGWVEQGRWQGVGMTGQQSSHWQGHGGGVSWPLNAHTCAWHEGQGSRSLWQGRRG